MPAAVWAAVSQLIDNELAAAPSGLAVACRRIGRGGKRTRATLTLLCARLGGAAWETAIPLAAAIELLHLATLIHDDLIDGATVRRGRPTVNALEGPETAVLGGDLCIGTALRLAAAGGGGAAARLAATLVELCGGQALEAQSRFDPHVTVGRALAVAGSKTGSLMAAACGLGAVLSRPAAQDFDDAVSGYGHAVGIALQLIDDLLDVWADENQVGKPTGTDFANGVVTVPAVYAMAKDPRLGVLLRPGLSESQRDHANGLLRRADARDATVEEIGKQLERADASLRLIHPADVAIVDDLRNAALGYAAWQLNRILPGRHLSLGWPAAAPSSPDEEPVRADRQDG